MEDNWSKDFTARMQDLQKRSETLTENLSTASGRASSPDGSVRVEVGASGALHSIEFVKDISEHTPTQLSALVMKTVHTAQRQAAEQATQAMTEFGIEGEAMARFVSYQPPLDEEELAELDADNADFGVNTEVEAEEAAPPPAAAPPVRPRVVEDDEDEEDNAPW
ncbi:YbaB/EbfC family nucleoid-associated protein [Sciscionella sediminilitoris]|uniref:YbaB/EbfC family nucleoid-associated protein n=1 Tax=Sciscionella sediminilitoris TaxID=1445613 RepID=UPI0004DF1AD4|nr:YbaB/EbfC family nucleoid-associated protein [Sciscionella sp. SE31]